jgi:hypothetical protein
MTIVNVGLSHRFAPAEVLEKLAVPSAELGDVLTRLHTVPSIGPEGPVYLDVLRQLFDLRTDKASA